MRILTITNELGPGGTERAAQNCTRVYRSANHHVAVLGLDKGGSRADELAAEGVPVWIGGYSPMEVDAAVDAAVAWAPDLIHIHRPGLADPKTAHALRRLKSNASSRLPVIETSHFSRCDRTADANLIDVHVHMTEWCLWKWRQWSRGMRPPPIGVVVPHLITDAFLRVSEAQRNAFRDAHGIPRDAFVFGRAGQPDPTCWSATTLEAFVHVASSDSRPWLVLAGLPDAIRTMADRLEERFRRRIIILPFIRGDEALRQFYSSLDCFLHANPLGESFGYVLIEAMRCGCPAVTMSTPARSNSQVEVVGHNHGGLVVSDMRSMTEAMNMLMDDALLLRRLSEGGVERVERRFARDVVAPNLLRLVESTALARDADDLRKRLADAGFTSHVSSERINSLMNDALGTVPAFDRMMKRLMHRPAFYASYVWAKRTFA